jgi:hypothetical protein
MLGMIVRMPDGKIKYNVRVYKGNRLYGEVYIESGTAQVRCRECMRLHTIRFVKEQPVIESAP